MPSSSEHRKALAAAIEHFSRSRESRPDAQADERLQDWIDEAPENREAMDELRGQWSALETLKSDPSILYIREEVRRDVRDIRRWRTARNAIAASLVAGLMILAGLTPSLYQGYVNDRARAHALVLTSGVGQLRTVRLADGSQAVLDTDTVLKVWQVKNGRHVELVRGRARFKVAKDPRRPFSVLAANSVVTAVGTDFDVYLRRDGVRVNLVEGRLRVRGQDRDHGAPNVEMSAGYQFTATKTGWGLARSDTVAGTAWTENELSFKNSTLEDIVGELNRYSDDKILIADRSVGQRRMTAMISSVDRQAFLVAVDALGLARVQRHGDRIELIAR